MKCKKEKVFILTLSLFPTLDLFLTKCDTNKKKLFNLLLHSQLLKTVDNF